MVYSIYRENITKNEYIDYKIAYVITPRSERHRIVGFESCGEIGINMDIIGKDVAYLQKRLDCIADRCGWRWVGKQESISTIRYKKDGRHYNFSFLECEVNDCELDKEVKKEKRRIDSKEYQRRIKEQKNKAALENELAGGTDSREEPAKD